MSSGNTSSHRWQPDRFITDAERATYWQQRYNQAIAERDALDLQCQKLAMKVAEYDRMFCQFKQGGE